MPQIRAAAGLDPRHFTCTAAVWSVAFVIVSPALSQPETEPLRGLVVALSRARFGSSDWASTTTQTKYRPDFHRLIK
jgi:hypothetical protein